MTMKFITFARIGEVFVATGMPAQFHRVKVGPPLL
jgi:hypothetical protein